MPPAVKEEPLGDVDHEEVEDDEILHAEDGATDTSTTIGAHKKSTKKQPASNAAQQAATAALSAAGMERLSRPPPQLVVPMEATMLAARKRLKRADGGLGLPSTKRPALAAASSFPRSSSQGRPMPRLLSSTPSRRGRPGVKRRTEVDRQLEILIPGGRFSEPSQNAIVRVGSAMVGGVVYSWACICMYIYVCDRVVLLSVVQIYTQVYTTSKQATHKQTNNHIHNQPHTTHTGIAFVQFV